MATTSSFQNMAQTTRIWDFPKLKGQANYLPWTKNILSALEYGGIALLNVVVDGRNVFPDDLPVETTAMLVPEGGGEAVRTITTAGPTQAQIVQYNNDLALWNELNSQAKSLIYTMCEDGAREAVEDDNYATDRWIRLEVRIRAMP